MTHPAGTNPGSIAHALGRSVTARLHTLACTAAALAVTAGVPSGLEIVARSLDDAAASVRRAIGDRPRHPPSEGPAASPHSRPSAWLP